MGEGGQRHDPADLPRERDPVPIVQEAGCGPGRAWKMAENFVSIEIRTPANSARSESLYRLQYPIFVSVHNMPQKYNDNNRKNI